MPTEPMPAEKGEIVLRVPGSIANLGPGFDTLAVAVQLYLTLRVRRVKGNTGLRFEFVNQTLDGENYIERAFRFIAERHEQLVNRCRGERVDRPEPIDGCRGDLCGRLRIANVSIDQRQVV